MGRTVIPKYRLEAVESDGKPFRCAWRGKVTAKRLADWIESYHNSLKSDGVNAHISKALGYIPLLRSAKIVQQSTARTVLAWKAPMFMAF